PSACIVFEDSPKGVESAAHAGMQAVLVTTTHQKQEFVRFINIITFINDFKHLSPALHQLNGLPP
ncbi:MAG: hypothetical protein HC867_08665, partial [Bacteroidia bacterium]|nr:hypothetical protein [Bacteroidia bacterium]